MTSFICLSFHKLKCHTINSQLGWIRLNTHRLTADHVCVVMCEVGPPPLGGWSTAWGNIHIGTPPPYPTPTHPLAWLPDQLRTTQSSSDQTDTYIHRTHAQTLNSTPVHTRVVHKLFAQATQPSYHTRAVNALRMYMHSETNGVLV